MHLGTQRESSSRLIHKVYTRPLLLEQQTSAFTWSARTALEQAKKKPNDVRFRLNRESAQCTVVGRSVVARCLLSCSVCMRWEIYFLTGTKKKTAATAKHKRKKKSSIRNDLRLECARSLPYRHRRLAHPKPMLRYDNHHNNWDWDAHLKWMEAKKNIAA